MEKGRVRAIVSVWREEERKGGREGGAITTSSSAGPHHDRDLGNAGGRHVGLVVEDASEVVWGQKKGREGRAEVSGGAI